MRKDDHSPNASLLAATVSTVGQFSLASVREARIVQVVTMQQPPADLLISITPGSRRLVEAAARRGAYHVLSSQQVG